MDRVLALADRLRQAGIDAILDQYETAPPEGWPKWMDRQIEEADFVLIVCTETYFNRVGGKAKPGIGRGVKWESLLAYQDIYDNDSLNAKYIPVLLDGVDESHIPRPLRATDRYLLADAQEYEKLYRRITGQPLVVKPELGTIQSLPPRPRQQSFAPLNLWNVPHERNPAFTGRSEILEALRAKLQKNKREVLSGLGGIGKTQIAAEYAHRHRNEYSAVFWIFADSEQSLSTGFVSIAKQLDLPEKDNAEQASITAAVRRWLDEHDDWLLIFDNADQPELLRAFLPQQGRGHILLTSRAHVFHSLGIVKPLEIHELQPAEARGFLLKRTGREGASNEIAEVDALAKQFGYLPLVLEQAGAFILEREASFANYLASFRKRRSDFLKQHKPVLGTSHEPLATTWRLNFEQVERFPASADLLRLSAFLAPDAIPLELLEKGVAEVSGPLASKLNDAKDDPLAVDEVLKPLMDYSLIRRNLETRSYSIHPLVQEVMRDQMTLELQKSLAETVVDIVDATFPDVEFGNWPDCERLIGHALACANNIDLFKIESETAACLLNQAAYYFSERAQYEASEPLYRLGLEIFEKVLGPNHDNTASCLSNLALLYDNQCRYEEAEPLHLRALEIRETVRGADHPDTALSLNNLAGLYYYQGKYEEAEPLYRRALKIYENVPGLEHPGAAFTMNNLAELYIGQGKYREAEPLLRLALENKEKMLGPAHPQTALNLNNLAGLCRHLGKYEEAESLYRRALEITERAWGRDHPRTAGSLSNLASLYDSQGKHEKAEPMHLRALEITEKVLGPVHPHTALSLNNLAGLYRDQGRYEEAELLCRRTLEITETTMGPVHPHTALSLNNLAGLYHVQGKYGEAEPLYRRSLTIDEKVLGLEHPDTASDLNNLAMLYADQGRYEEAEPLYRRALEIRDKALGPEHPDTADSMNNLAELYRQQSTYSEAEPLHRRALEIREKAQGQEHPDTATSLSNLGMLYFQQARYENLVSLFEHALEIREKALGSDHPDTATSLSNLAFVYSYQGRHAEAEPLYRCVLDIREKAFGPEHPYTLQICDNLINLYQKQDKLAEAEILERRFKSKSKKKAT
jgi:tetratricopeptide (TPR) repeat protein